CAARAAPETAATPPWTSPVKGTPPKSTTTPPSTTEPTTEPTTSASTPPHRTTTRSPTRSGPTWNSSPTPESSPPVKTDPTTSTPSTECPSTSTCTPRTPGTPHRLHELEGQPRRPDVLRLQRRGLPRLIQQTPRGSVRIPSPWRMGPRGLPLHNHGVPSHDHADSPRGRQRLALCKAAPTVPAWPDRKTRCAALDPAPPTIPPPARRAARAAQGRCGSRQQCTSTCAPPRPEPAATGRSWRQAQPNGRSTVLAASPRPARRANPASVPS